MLSPILDSRLPVEMLKFLRACAETVGEVGNGIDVEIDGRDDIESGVAGIT